MDLAIWDDLSIEVSGTSVVRVALVSDSAEELLGDEGPVVMTFAGMTSRNGTDPVDRATSRRIT
ncbi:MAG TPA: hypothetical protein VFC03_17295 [Acidimicrobiales bacterium]|jgi:hypothetical protein|nr:hypothetical protein [Acidimicrobiales bacterium]